MTIPGERPDGPRRDAADANGIAADLRGFGPLGIAALVVILAGNALFIPLSALLVLAWARLSNTPWQDIGFARPRSRFGALAGGVVLGVALKLTLKAVVMPLLGADPINHAYHYLEGNRAAIPGALFLMIVGAGFGEETVFRGYLFERFGRLFGRGRATTVAIVAVISVWFGLDHYSVQGLAGAEQATIVGLVFGSIVAVTGRLWLVMCAHAAFDLTAYALIYWGWETRVAHWVFGR
jgi:membrane protease YdiL (CAAX protease family)